MNDVAEVIKAASVSKGKLSEGASDAKSIDSLLKNPCIVGLSTASPAFKLTQDVAKGYADEFYEDKLIPSAHKILKQFLDHPGINSRHLAFDDFREFIKEDAQARIERFSKAAVQLSVQASRDALQKAGIAPNEVTGLVVNTCTGYLCPGISNYVIEELGLNNNVLAHDLLGYGCGAAVPNLQLSRSLIAPDKKSVVLSVSVEISSATFQMGNDTSLLLSNAIFGDGAAAYILTNSPSEKDSAPLEVISTAHRIEPKYREEIRYIHKNGELHNQLTSKLPNVAPPIISELIDELLIQNNVTKGDIKYWAFHPGGHKIIDNVQQALNLNDDTVQPVRTVFRDFGNMSSPTVLFILNDILKSQPIKSGDLVVMLAFGAGFSAHAGLLRAK